MCVLKNAVTRQLWRTDGQFFTALNLVIDDWWHYVLEIRNVKLRSGKNLVCAKSSGCGKTMLQLSFRTPTLSLGQNWSVKLSHTTKPRLIMQKRLHCSVTVALVCLLALQTVFAQSQGSTATLTTTAPSAVGMSPTQLTNIDSIVEAEIAKKQLPGAVVLVGRQGKIVWRRAYGNRALEPQVEAMTTDTIFDLASLTKIVATATSVMILVERGVIRLGDPVSRYIPEFAENGKRAITVEHLLVHRSGLIADNDIRD